MLLLRKCTKRTIFSPISAPREINIMKRIMDKRKKDWAFLCIFKAIFSFFLLRIWSWSLPPPQLQLCILVMNVIYVIGTGASCIFPLLGAKIYSWRFVATEINHESMVIAIQNVKQNDLCDKIQIVHSKESFFEVLNF